MKALTGTGVAIVTPFTKKGDVDHSALSKLVKHIVSGGVEYIVINGTTGESVTLTSEEKESIIDTVKKANGNKVPMVLGIGGNNTSELIQSFKKTDVKPFDAILSVAPYYNKPNQEGYYQHYKAISEVSKKPIILYNVPGRTGSNVTSDTQLRIAHACKNVVATKEASGNIEQMMHIIKNKPKHFSLISGDDALTLPIIAAGGIGVISVVANAFPKDFSNMVRACLKYDFKTAQPLHYKLLDITAQLFADGNPGGVKQALSHLGICDSYVRLPLCEPNDKVKAQIKTLVKALK